MNNKKGKKPKGEENKKMNNKKGKKPNNGTIFAFYCVLNSRKAASISNPEQRSF